MPVKRFDLGEWLDSPLSRRRLDLGGLDEQRQTVQEIVARVAREGDAALRDYGRAFDGWAPEAGESFRLEPREMRAALDRLGPEDRSALELAARRIREFHQTQSFEVSSGLPGRRLLTGPVERAAVYAPGGRAAYPSTVLMGVIPARVAGVKEVLVATPPRSDGTVPLAILAAAQLAGADAVYRVGGAQAIAALAYGTAGVPRVDVVVGPGNVYVTLAKREVFGLVGLDGIAGPTEIVVVADASARPDFVAADLASQLEHDPMAWALLVTDSAGLADAVDEEFSSLVQRLDRAEVIGAAHCCIVVTDTVEQAIQVANDFAPEHLELMLEDSERWVTQVSNAGAIFAGPYSAVTLGDYVIGPNHVLPTGGAARFGSPLGVYTFLRRSTIASVNQGELQALQEACRALARLEGFTAHANAVEVRLDG